MSEVIPFPPKPDKPEAQVQCDVFSLEHGPNDLIPALYSPGDAIPVQLRQGETEVLVETEIRTLEDYQTLRQQYPAAPEVKLYYRVTGTIRFRWLWLWGEDWEPTAEQAFGLLQQRFGRNLREEWMSERHARSMDDESSVYCSFIPCDWATFPESFPYSPHAKRFRMAVINGKAAFKALAEHERRLEEERQGHVIKLNLLDPEDWLRFQELYEHPDYHALLDVDLTDSLAFDRYRAYLEEKVKQEEEARAKGELPPLAPVPPRPGQPVASNS